jgi:hypothetical protein
MIGILLSAVANMAGMAGSVVAAGLIIMGACAATANT